MNYKVVQEYIKSFSPIEIEKLLNFLSRNQILFNCWQKNGHAKRIVQGFYMDKLNPVEPEIRIYPSNDSFNCKEFDKNGPLYAYTDEQKFVTEFEIVYIAKKHIIVMPPEYVYKKSSKKIPRIDTFNKDINIFFEKSSKEFEFPVLNISNTGISFIIDRANYKYFCYPNDIIHIKQIGANNFMSTIKASIVYTKKLEDSRTYRVGAKFFDEIDVNPINLNIEV